MKDKKFFIMAAAPANRAAVDAPLEKTLRSSVRVTSGTAPLFISRLSYRAGGIFLTRKIFRELVRARPLPL